MGYAMEPQGHVYSLPTCMHHGLMGHECMHADSTYLCMGSFSMRACVHNLMGMCVCVFRAAEVFTGAEGYDGSLAGKLVLHTFCSWPSA